MNLDHFSENFSEYELSELLKLYRNPDGRVWGEIADKLTIDQRLQVSYYDEKISDMEKANILSQMSPEERQKYDNDMYVGGAMHFARDHWFVTIFEVYDIVNKQGQFKDWTLESIKESSPVSYCYEEVVKRLGYMVPSEKFTFFGEGSEFAMCYPCEFEMEGIKFGSAFQAICYWKAELFRDRNMMDSILQTNDYNQLLEYKKQVRRFAKIIWDMQIGKLLKDIMKAKFEIPFMKEKLRATSGTTIALADQSDFKWGIGIGIEDVTGKTRSDWNGKNLLGELITDLRIDLFGHY